MISRLKGDLQFTSPTTLVITTSGGVTFELLAACNDYAWAKLDLWEFVEVLCVFSPQAGYTMAAFPSIECKQLTLQLLKVQGYGLTSIINLYNKAGSNQVKDVLDRKDTIAFSKLPGITPSRLNKVIAAGLLDSAAIPDKKKKLGREQLDAVEGLKALGYAATKAKEVVERCVANNPDIGEDTAEIIRLCIKK
jgi:Holliday junction resolvasome RuvABC DNA-binding subunit